MHQADEVTWAGPEVLESACVLEGEGGGGSRGGSEILYPPMGSF